MTVKHPSTPSKQEFIDVFPAMGWMIGTLLSGGVATESVVNVLDVGINIVHRIVDPTTVREPWLWIILFVWFGAFIVAVPAFVVCFKRAAREVRLIISGVDVDLKDANTETRCSALIMALSRTHDLDGIHSHKKNSRAVGPGLLEEFKQQDSTLGEHSWQQAVRAIDQHVDWNTSPPRLPVVRVLTSCGEDGSSGQWGQFQDLIKRLYGSALREADRTLNTFLQKAGDPLDFEDIRLLYTVIEAEVVCLEAKGIGLEDIMIDATGGQKTFSIAASILTLRSPGLRFQYVRNNGEVRYYNAKAKGVEPPQL